MDGPKVIVTKSTVPVGTAKRVEALVREHAAHSFAVVSNPEFLKEGNAVNDFMRPDRVVLGGTDPDAIALLRTLYAPFMRREDRLLVMDCASAELTKYAANSMLAMRISFMNELAGVAERVGANVESVRRGLGSDSRIGNAFLFPGAGFGGSCFSKDLAALLHLGESHGLDLRTVRATLEVNAIQKRLLLHKAKREFGNYFDGKTFAVWGLAFKPGTDDMRDAPSIEVPDFERMRDLLRTRVVFDGRNIWDRGLVESHGFTYYGIGV